MTARVLFAESVVLAWGTSIYALAFAQAVALGRAIGATLGGAV